MNYRKIIAIVPGMSIENIEKGLNALGVPGMTVCHKKGLGEYRNFYTKDKMVDCVEVTVYIEKSLSQDTVDIISKAAYNGLSSNGIVAVLPVENIYHIKDYENNV